MDVGQADAARAGLSRRNSAASEDAQGAHNGRNGALETHQPDASAANRALELLGREVNLFTEKKEVGKPGDFDHMSDEELIQFIELQGEVVRELERELLPPPAPKQRKGAKR